MRGASAALLRTVTGSHSMTARARVCTTFQTGTAPTGTEIEILGGDVTADARQPVRATLDLLTTGDWPRRAGDQLAPYGNEIFVERGVVFGNGTVEWVSLGYYRVEAPEQTGPLGPVRILGKDRMAGIIDARLLSPRQFDQTATYGEVVDTLVTEVYPTATVEWDDSTDLAALGRPLIAEEDRYAFIDDLVTAKAKIWYWDHRGVLVIKSQPSVDNPVFDIAAGGVLVSLSRRLTRERVYNAVVATGEGTDVATPARGVAVDLNPTSPTYYHGRFGPVPRFFSSPFIHDASSARDAASSLLRRSLGLPYNIDLSLVPNPALEPWDPVRVRAASHEGIETHVLERLRTPLVADAPMTGATRERTVVLVGLS